jgi:phosphoglucosamine mutase
MKKSFENLGYKDLNTQDGVRAGFEDSWALVRASGTEPKIRITVEAEEEKSARILYDKVFEIVKGCVMQ